MSPWHPYNSRTFRGGVAQLGERIVRIDEVVGSIPILSTTYPKGRTPCPAFLFFTPRSHAAHAARGKMAPPFPARYA